MKIGSFRFSIQHWLIESVLICLSKIGQDLIEILWHILFVWCIDTRHIFTWCIDTIQHTIGTYCIVVAYTVAVIKQSEILHVTLICWNLFCTFISNFDWLIVHFPCGQVFPLSFLWRLLLPTLQMFILLPPSLQSCCYPSLLKIPISCFPSSSLPSLATLSRDSLPRTWGWKLQQG